MSGRRRASRYSTIVTVMFCSVVLGRSDDGAAAPPQATTSNATIVVRDMHSTVPKASAPGKPLASRERLKSPGTEAQNAGCVCANKRPTAVDIEGPRSGVRGHPIRVHAPGAVVVREVAGNLGYADTDHGWSLRASFVGHRPPSSPAPPMGLTSTRGRPGR